MTLEDLKSRIKICTLCGLSRNRKKSVPGEGSSSANLMLIGEAPGAEEDNQGIPFVGAAGKHLDKLLDILEFTRKEVFITNVVKCRPPKNRVPEWKEREACLPYLKEQILIIKPNLIVTLGNTALETLTNEKFISRVHGKIITKDDLQFYPMYHPAAVLHNPNLRNTLVSDTNNLKRLLNDSKNNVSPSDRKLDNFF